MRLLDSNEYPLLARALGDTPETVIPLHQLRCGLAQAIIIGEPEHFQAVVIQANDEPSAFGDDAAALWTILPMLDDWMCINTGMDTARELHTLMKTRYSSVRWYEDVYFVLDGAPQMPENPPDIETHLLNMDDLALLESAPAQLQGAGFGSTAAMLRDGLAAGSILEGRLVAVAHTSALSERYADVGVYTHENWRRRGLSTYATGLVMAQLQARGLIPVWSTGEDNRASLRVAEKLGLREVSRRVYLIPA